MDQMESNEKNTGAIEEGGNNKIKDNPSPLPSSKECENFIFNGHSENGKEAKEKQNHSNDEVSPNDANQPNRRYPRRSRTRVRKSEEFVWQKQQKISTRRKRKATTSTTIPKRDEKKRKSSQAKRAQQPSSIVNGSVSETIEQSVPNCEKYFENAEQKELELNESNVRKRKNLDKPRRNRANVDVDDSNKKSFTPSIERKSKAYVPLPILSPGDMYSTPYGVVEVVKDSNVPPDHGQTLVYSMSKADSNALSRKKKRIASAFKRAYVLNAAKLRKHRKTIKKSLRSLYGFQKEVDPSKGEKCELKFSRIFFLENKRDKFPTALFSLEGKFIRRSPTNITMAKKDPIAQEKFVDPRMPVDSYPDRIVECFLVSDERKRILLHLDDLEVDSCSKNQSTKMKLFLRRRCLTERYDPQSKVYPCYRCGKVFGSRTGARHHLEKQCCLNRTPSLPLWVAPPPRTRVYKKRNEKYEQAKRERKKARDAAEAAMRNAILGQHIDPDKRNVMMQNDNSHVAVYEEAWNLLEFKPKKKKKRPPWVQFDKMLSCFYPPVYRSLGFRANLSRPKNNSVKPSLTTLDANNRVLKKRRTSAEVKLEKEKRRQEKAREKEKKSPPPVVVDIMVLVEEIDIGRYPSVKRYNGEHSDNCVICKKTSGVIYCCEFCKNACHLECLREKVTIRDPEPEDDFMCHNCIQKILARRSRAEKRRLIKRDSALEKVGINPPHSSSPNVSNVASSLTKKNSSNISTIESHNSLLSQISLPQLHDSENQELCNDSGAVQKCPDGGPGGLVCCVFCAQSYSQVLADVSNEMEIQIISMVGREVSELIELLKDAQLRAQQAVDLAKENDCRRMLLDEEF